MHSDTGFCLQEHRNKHQNQDFDSRQTLKCALCGYAGLFYVLRVFQTNILTVLSDRWKWPKLSLAAPRPPRHQIDGTKTENIPVSPVPVIAAFTVTDSCCAVGFCRNHDFRDAAQPTIVEAGNFQPENRSKKARM